VKTLLIELIDIKKRYSATEVLKGINLKADEGEFITIRGKSGAGKTTLLKIIGLLESPNDGKLKMFGQDAERLSDDEKSNLRLHHIGFVFQFFNLIPSLTITENIELPLALAGTNKKERKERAHELLTYFDLTNLAERFPETLSGGERQRVAVIRALANNPKIILADEPTSSIDNENSKILMSLLSNINKERKVTVVVTTIDLYEKMPSNREYLLEGGLLHKMI